MTTDEILQIGMEHHSAGRLAEAERIYRDVLATDPANLTALHSLGTIELTRGRHAEALRLLGHVAHTAPGNVVVLYNYAQALRTVGRLDEAISCLREAVRINPSESLVHLNLATLLLLERDDVPGAIEAFRAVASLKPNDATAHTNRGYALHQNGQLDEAMMEQRTALRLDPDLPDAHNNLATLLRDLDRPEEAYAEAQRALQLRPDYPQAFNTLASATYDLGRTREALTYSRRAVELMPQLAIAHRNKGMSLLALGEFAQGWPEYEWRNATTIPPLPQQPTPPPRWDGSPLDGRTLLLVAEQGLGDAILTVRYATMLAEQPYSARVLVACPQPLQALLRTAAGVEGTYYDLRELPHVDAHFPMMSLPGRLGTTGQTIPSKVPYLKVDPDRAAMWREKISIADASPCLRVGLTWASGTTAADSRRRTMSLAALAPLAAVEGVTFFSLQKDDAQRQAAHPPAGMKLINFTDELHDFADTAALIDSLDLVITVDTAVCNLAGALAKPVWTMLPFVSDWRWLERRADTPWYPTMRLFRQTSRGDWGSVVESIVNELRKLRR